MLSRMPIMLEKVKKENRDREILRAALIAELDAISFYEQMADLTEDERIKKVLLEVAREEKTHTGEFQTLLLKLDREQEKELQAGKEEVEELIPR
jgi:rubrerythrin